MIIETTESEETLEDMERLADKSPIARSMLQLLHIIEKQAIEIEALKLEIQRLKLSL